MCRQRGSADGQRVRAAAASLVVRGLDAEVDLSTAAGNLLVRLARSRLLFWEHGRSGGDAGTGRA